MSTFKFLSVASGIEAASVAWHPLGWQAVAFSEIEAFPCAVLAHHFPGVPNRGDMTRFKEWPDATIDVLVGGTPCQSFSVAGLRAGMADPRGNLALTFLAIAARYRPRWILWENVPGVLSSEGGADFAAFLGGLGELGYGWAYRVLDAQYFGLPQRRRRVFVVGCARGWAAAAAVLFESAGMYGDPPPRRSKGQGVAAPIAPGSAEGSGYRNDADTTENLVAGTVTSRSGNTGPGPDEALANQLISGAVTSKWSKGTGGPSGDECYNLVTHALDSHSRGSATEDGTGRGMPLVAHTLRAEGFDAGGDGSSGTPIIAHTLRADGFDASEDGSGRGTPIVAVPLTAGNNANSNAAGRRREDDHNLVVAPVLEVHGRRGEGSQKDGLGIGNPGDPMFTLQAEHQHGVIAFDTTQITSVANRSNPQPGDPCHPLTAEGDPPTITLAYDMRGREGGAQFEGPHDTANIRAASGGSSRSYIASAAFNIERGLAPHASVEGSETVPALSASEQKGHSVIGPAAFNIYPASGQGADLEASETNLAMAVTTEDARKSERGTRIISPDQVGIGQGDEIAKTILRSGVRRLTPRECERLQGFPDDWTLIPLSRAQRRAVAADMAAYYRRTNQMLTDADLLRLSKDGPRYKALGNSMAVTNIRWLGRQIARVDALLKVAA